MLLVPSLTALAEQGTHRGLIRAGVVPAVPWGWGGIALSYAIWPQSLGPPQPGHAGGEQALPMPLSTLPVVGGMASRLSGTAQMGLHGGVP